jgi:hypothetical protein
LISRFYFGKTLAFPPVAAMHALRCARFCAARREGYIFLRLDWKSVELAAYDTAAWDSAVTDASASEEAMQPTRDAIKVSLRLPELKHARLAGRAGDARG